MGGKALDGRRLSTPEYLEMSQHLRNLLLTMFVRVYIPISFGGKESHGDIDLVVTGPRCQEFSFAVQELLEATRFQFCPPTYSYLHQGVQVDVHVCPEEEFETCCMYKSHGDVSPLIGMLCHGIGCIYGMDGLRMVFRFHRGQFYSWGDPTYERHQITLSRDSRRICEFLGLSYERLQSPFNHSDEIVTFLKESPYFDRGVYHPDAKILSCATHKRRVRRPLFQEILECLMDPDIPYVQRDCAELHRIHQSALEFFDRVDEYQLSCQRILNKYYYHQRINGAFVGKLTGLAGPHLGELMNHVREQVSLDHLRNLDDQALGKEILSILAEHDPN